MQIKHLSIRNYRSIKKAEISNISKIFALIGRNNAGKSSVLHAVQILFCTEKPSFADFHKKTSDSMEVVAIFADPSDVKPEKELKVVATKDKDTGKVERGFFVNGAEASSEAKFKRELPELLSISDIRNPDESRAGGQKTTLLNKILKLGDEKTGEKFLELSEAIKELKEDELKEVSNKITANFQSILGEKNYSVSVTPNVDVDKGLDYHTSILDSNINIKEGVDIQSSGTGLQSMYILALLEVWAELSNKKSDAILLIEEPEVYLHPEYQRRMFEAIRRIAEGSEGNQVIFSTHSPIMISDIYLTQSVRQVVLDQNGETQIEDVKIEKVINELGIKYEDILNPKVVLFVEGKDDSRFFKLLLDIDSVKLKIIPTTGFQKLSFFAFIKIMSNENVKNKFFVISDSDGESPENRKQEQVNLILDQIDDPSEKLKEELDTSIIVLERYEVESYFLKPKLIKEAFPNLEVNKIKDFITQYETKYAEGQEALANGEVTKEKFKNYLKPKKIFEPYKNEESEKAYREFWKDCDEFLEVKDLIAEECKSLGEKSISWFDLCSDVLLRDEPEGDLQLIKERILEELSS